MWNWGVAAGSAPGWPGQSARYCPKQQGMEASCRPWSRWCSGCAPAGPRRSCKFSWTWISGSGTRFWPVKKIQNTIHVSFLLDIENNINLNDSLNFNCCLTFLQKKLKWCKTISLWTGYDLRGKGLKPLLKKQNDGRSWYVYSYISLLVIFCIIVYVTNKQILNLGYRPYVLLLFICTYIYTEQHDLIILVVFRK